MSSKQNTHVFPSGVSAFKRNSYDAKYIPEAGTSVEKPSKHEKNFPHFTNNHISIADQIIKLKNARKHVILKLILKVINAS